MITLFRIDARGLAAFRIALAALVVVDVFLRAFDVDALLTDDGVLPRASLFWYRVGEYDRFSLHALSGDATLQWFLLGLTVAAAACLGAGRQTRLASIATWALVTSMQFRNPGVLNGGDILLRALLFWAMFLPLDLRARFGGERGEPPGTGVASMASAALLLQLAIVYLFAAAHKWGEPLWRNLDAFRVAMQTDGAATGFGQWVASLPVVPEAGTATVLILESLGPLVALAAWKSDRLRTTIVLFFVAFHLLGLATVFRFGLFPLVMVAAWLPWFPSTAWDGLERTLRVRERQTESADRGASAVVNVVVASILASVLWHNMATIGWAPGDSAGPRNFLREPHHLVGLGQRWSLWTRPPSNRYFVVAATTHSGEDIDLRRDGAPLDFTEAPLRSRDARWWKMELGLTRESAAPLRVPYACYWLRQWNAEHSDAQQVDGATFWMIRGTREEMRAGAGKRIPLVHVVDHEAAPTAPTTKPCPL